MTDVTATDLILFASQFVVAMMVALVGQKATTEPGNVWTILIIVAAIGAGFSLYGAYSKLKGESE